MFFFTKLTQQGKQGFTDHRKSHCAVIYFIPGFCVKIFKVVFKNLYRIQNNNNNNKKCVRDKEKRERGKNIK